MSFAKANQHFPDMTVELIPPSMKSYNSAVMAFSFSEAFDLQSREVQRANSQLNDKTSAETYFFYRAAAGG